MRFRFLGLFLAIAIVSGFVLFRARIAADDVAVAESGTKSARVSFAIGIVEGRTEKTDLRFETSGRIEQVSVREGDRVEAGQVIAQLDRRQAVAEWELAKANLAKAQAEFDSERSGTKKEQIRMAEAELKAKQAQLRTETLGLERIARLWQDGTVPQQQHDDQVGLVETLGHEVARLQARLDLLHNPTKQQQLDALRAAIHAAESHVELAALAVERCVLVSPIAGVVVDVEIRPGELVDRASRAPAIAIVDDSELRVRAHVEEHDAFDLDVGMPARIRLQSSEQRAIYGTVSRLSPKLAQKQFVDRSSDERFDVRTRECWIHLDQPVELVLFSHVDVEILIEPATAEEAESVR